MRRLLSALLPAILLAGLVGSSTSAFSIVPTLFVNGSDAGFNVKVGNTATGKGKTEYNSWVGPVPLPATYYIVHTVPTLHFKTPQYVGGNTGNGSFPVGTNIYGQTAYIYSKKGDMIGELTIYTNVSAKSDLASTSSRFWTHGTGSGHTADANADVRITSH